MMKMRIVDMIRKAPFCEGDKKKRGDVVFFGTQHSEGASTSQCSNVPLVMKQKHIVLTW